MGTPEEVQSDPRVIEAAV
ncbi:MAG TPA: hypothetical protein VFE92_14155 [Dermatophilaceae bacterium]|nr:hypothetical protein [Dermatophilaceae bacterium]